MNNKKQNWKKGFLIGVPSGTIGGGLLVFLMHNYSTEIIGILAMVGVLIFFIKLFRVVFGIV